MQHTPLQRVQYNSEQLARMEERRVARDEAIREAHQAGESIAEIARRSGLSRTMIYKILDE